MKLLGGISSQQSTAAETPSAQNGRDEWQNQPAPSGMQNAPAAQPAVQEGAHNVMAEVLERHERISQRVKNK